MENRLHWTLDVTFTEDESRVRKGNGQEIFGGFRRLALSILKRDTSLKKESIRGKTPDRWLEQPSPISHYRWQLAAFANAIALVPKVIDFGVSTALSQPLTERKIYTSYG